MFATDDLPVRAFLYQSTRSALGSEAVLCCWVSSHPGYHLSRLARFFGASTYSLLLNEIHVSSVSNYPYFEINIRKTPT